MRRKSKELGSSFSSAVKRGINNGGEIDIVIFLVQCGAGVTIDRTFALTFQLAI